MGSILSTKRQTTHALEPAVAVQACWPTDNAARLLLIEERERRMLARELHDDLSQILAIIKIRLTPLAAGEIQASINEIMALVDKADRSARVVGRQLSPPLLHLPGMAEVFRSLADEMQSACGLSVQFDDQAKAAALVAFVKSVLYHCLRELLINVARHSGSKAASVTFKRDGEMLVLAVSDEGCGFDAGSVCGAAAESERERYGLSAVAERMRALGGTMDIVSIPGHGATVTLSLPISRALMTPQSP